MNILEGKNIKSENTILRRLFKKGVQSYAFSDLSKAIGPMVDLAFVSLFYGPMGVTVIGYVSPLIVFYELVGTGISSGARNKVSTLIGAGQMDEANQVYSTSVILGTAISMILTILTLVFCTGVCKMLGARQIEILSMTRKYLYGYVIGIPFFSLNRVLKLYLELEGQYKRSNLTSLMTTVVDVVADAIVVFVMHGNMFWIGLATSIGYILPFFITASYFFSFKSRSLFRFSFKLFRKDISRDIIKFGASPATVKGSNAIGGILINNMLTAVNVNYLVAVFGVFSQITVFVRSAWLAAADTMLGFAGVFIGEEDRASLKELQKASLKYALIPSLIVMVALFVLATPLSGFFMKTKDPTALIMCRECIRISCFSLVFNPFVYNFNNYLMAVRKIRFSLIYGFLLECGNIVPVTFFMLNIFSYYGAFAAKIVHLLGMSLIGVLYICMYKGTSKLEDKVLLLPESFGFSADDEIAIVATSAEEIMDISRIAIAFALEHAADKKRARTVGLITEEMSGLYTEHGFSDGKTHRVNVRLVSKEDDLIIRMRDDFESINITDIYRKEMEEKGTVDDLGLAIVMRMAKDVKYAAAFGANNLIIRI